MSRNNWAKPEEILVLKRKDNKRNTITNISAMTVFIGSNRNWNNEVIILNMKKVVKSQEECHLTNMTFFFPLTTVLFCSS